MSKKIWQPKNVVEALWPIQLLSWLFSLGIIHYPINQSRIGLSIFYTISTVSAYLILLIYTISLGLNTPWFDSVTAIFFVIVYVNSFIYMSNILLVWVWRKVTI